MLFVMVAAALSVAFSAMAAAFSFTVALVTAAFTVTVALVAAALTVTVMSVASAVAMAALFGREELAVQTFSQFFFGCIPYGHDLAAEVQRLAGHRGVEVHRDLVFLHFHDHSVTDLSG